MWQRGEIKEKECGDEGLLGVVRGCWYIFGANRL
jgi:hypothetical protein